MPGKHARLSPSAAHRWLVCPGAPRMEAGGVDTTSPAAELGTRAHECLASLLLGETCDADLDPETRAKVDFAVDYIQKERAKYKKVTLEVEETLDAGAIIGRQDLWGTADIVMRGGTWRWVYDFKSGSQYVEVADNPQLIIYAIGLLQEKGWKSVTLGIIQGDEVRIWTLKRDEVRNLAAKYKAYAEATDPADAECRPSLEACRYCKGAGHCDAYAAVIEGDIEKAFAGVPAEIKDNAIPQRLLDLYVNKERVMQAFSMIEEHIRQRLVAGIEVPGFMLVSGKNSRAWKPGAEELLQLVGYETRESVLLSPAKFEKAHGKPGKDAARPLIDIVPGAPRVATILDSRTEIPASFKQVKGDSDNG